MAEIPASSETVQALRASIEARMGDVTSGRIRLKAPNSSRIVDLERNLDLGTERDQHEYYPILAVIQATLKGNPIFTNGPMKRIPGQEDRTYIIFERGDRQLQAVVEANGPSQRIVGEEEAQGLRRYVASLGEL